MKKYELTDETLQIGTITLHRIKAMVAFAGVDAGETGGWVEKEENLAQDGNAWVYGDARVYGDVWVSGNARVYGNAWVSDNAHHLEIGPIGSRNDTITFTREKNGSIFAQVGCFFGTLAEFREKVGKTHGENEHAQAYLLAAELAELRIDTTPEADKQETPDEAESNEKQG